MQGRIELEEEAAIVSHAFDHVVAAVATYPALQAYVDQFSQWNPYDDLADPFLADELPI